MIVIFIIIIFINIIIIIIITVLWKKLQIQEKAITEVKAAIKPYYQKKDITKEEYKEIVRKAVEKVSE